MWKNIHLRSFWHSRYTIQKLPQKYHSTKNLCLTILVDVRLGFIYDLVLWLQMTNLYNFDPVVKLFVQVVNFGLISGCQLVSNFGRYFLDFRQISGLVD